MQRLLLCLVSAALLGACKSERLVAARAEVADDDVRIAELEAKLKALRAEGLRVDGERKTWADQATEAERARLQLEGARAKLDGKPLPPALELSMALDAKDDSLGKLGARLAQAALGCTTPEADGFDGCSPPPLPDACDGVAVRIVNDLKWQCSHVLSGKDTRTLVLCQAPATLPQADVPFATEGNEVEGSMVRVAFSAKGRVFVADWPPPDLDRYRPPNAAELAACAASNTSAECVRDCDVRFDRLYTCGDVAGEGGDDAYGDGEEQNPELAAAEAEAARAEAEASRAREEVEYQRCVSRCPADTAENEERGEPQRMTFTLRNERFPGVLAFDVKLTGKKEERGVLVLRSLETFEDDADLKPGAKNELGTLDSVLAVTKLEQFETAEGDLLWFGPGLDGIQGARVRTKEGLPDALDPRVLCGLVPAQKQGAIAEACAKLTASPPDAGEAVDGGAP